MALNLFRLITVRIILFVKISAYFKGNIFSIFLIPKSFLYQWRISYITETWILVKKKENFYSLRLIFRLKSRKKIKKS